MTTLAEAALQSYKDAEEARRMERSRIAYNRQQAEKQEAERMMRKAKKWAVPTFKRIFGDDFLKTVTWQDAKVQTVDINLGMKNPTILLRAYRGTESGGSYIRVVDRNGTGNSFSITSLEDLGSLIASAKKRWDEDMQAMYRD